MSSVPAPLATADPSLELVRALRRLTPMQRKVLRVLPAHRSLWKALAHFGHSAATGHRWMRRPEFSRARELIEQQAIDAIGVTHHRILTETAAIAFSDPRKLFNPDGSLKPLNEIDDDTAAALSKIEMEELFEGTGEDRKRIGTLHKVSRWDKHKALELLGRYRRMWGDEAVKQEAPVGPGFSVTVTQIVRGAVIEGEVVGQRVVVALPGPPPPAPHEN